MNAEEFRKYGRQMVDYIADYLENIREREVVHKVTPGYLKKLLPNEAPENPEDFAEVFKDIDKFIMPGVSCHFLNSFMKVFTSNSITWCPGFLNVIGYCIYYICSWCMSRTTSIRICNSELECSLFLGNVYSVLIRIRQALSL